jgi:hypothetical protein
MARPRSNDPIEPMTLQNMRENGVRSLAVECHQYRHEVVMNVAMIRSRIARNNAAQSNRFAAPHYQGKELDWSQTDAASRPMRGELHHRAIP